MQGQPAHAPPRFDIWGKQIKSKPVALEEGTKLPPGWRVGPSSRTQTQLLEERRLERIPDISYDLDKDGKIGGQDTVISRRFDQDKDGKLDPHERKAAEEALSAGILQKYTWGADNALRHHSQRLVQVRGVTIDGDDYSGLLGTYPKFPVQDYGDRPKTYSELKRYRSEQKIEHYRQIKTDWDSLHPMKIQVNRELPPKSAPYFSLSFPTRTEKQNVEKAFRRESAGLGPGTSEINKTCKDPSLDYVCEPVYKTKSQMDEAKRRTMLQELHEKKNYNHITREQHMLARENQHIWIVPEGEENRTMRQLAEERRRETNEYNLKMFSSTTIGIHGKELPKFAEHNPEYWTFKPGYVSNPSIVSNLEVDQRRKYWAPIDTYKLTDKDASPPAPDSFKAVHVLSKREEKPMPKKPTQFVPEGFNPMEHRDLPAEGHKHKYRWTTLVHYFKKGSIFAPPKDPDLEKAEEKEVKNQEATSTNDAQSTNVVSTTSNLHIRKVATSGGKRMLKSSSQSLIRTKGFPDSDS